MDAALKKGAGLVVVVFIGFYLFTDPAGLAAFTKEAGATIWAALTSLFDALIRFINATTS